MHLVDSSCKQEKYLLKLFGGYHVSNIVVLLLILALVVKSDGEAPGLGQEEKE